MIDEPAHILASTRERFVLAEGPQWNAPEQTVSWVDIEGRTLSIAALQPNGALVVHEERVFDDRVSFAHPLSAGRYLVGLGRRLAISDASGVVDESQPLLPEGKRLNDAVIDPAGRLIAGGMSLVGAHEGNVLLRVELNGAVTHLDTDLSLSNGLGFSPDGSVLYSVDSIAGLVYRRAYDSDLGEVGEREVFASFSGVEPDGLAVDSHGCVWIALWGGNSIQRFDPAGALTASISFDAPHVTSLCFAGRESELMVVTTSILLLDSEQRDQYADAGRVHTLRSSIRGVIPHRWCAVPLSQVTPVSSANRVAQ